METAEALKIFTEAHDLMDDIIKLLNTPGLEGCVTQLEWEMIDNAHAAIKTLEWAHKHLSSGEAPF